MDWNIYIIKMTVVPQSDLQIEYNPYQDFSGIFKNRNGKTDPKTHMEIQHGQNGPEKG